jgi:aminopeptidase-like protein
MIDTIERNRVPVNRYKGEIFCSRFGLNIDAYDNPEGNKALFDIIFLIDGTRSVAEIAATCKVSVDSVSRVVDELLQRGLVDFEEN